MQFHVSDQNILRCRLSSDHCLKKQSVTTSVTYKFVQKYISICLCLMSARNFGSVTSCWCYQTVKNNHVLVLLSTVTCWEAVKFSAHPRVYTSFDIPYGIKANKRRLCYERVLRETNPQQTSVDYGWQNCPTDTSPSRNIMRREGERKMRHNYLHAQVQVH